MIMMQLLVHDPPPLLKGRIEENELEDDALATTLRQQVYWQCLWPP